VREGEGFFDICRRRCGLLGGLGFSRQIPLLAKGVPPPGGGATAEAHHGSHHLYARMRHPLHGLDTLAPQGGQPRPPQSAQKLCSHCRQLKRSLHANTISMRSKPGQSLLQHLQGGGAKWSLELRQLLRGGGEGAGGVRNYLHDHGPWTWFQHEGWDAPGMKGGFALGGLVRHPLPDPAGPPNLLRRASTPLPGPPPLQRQPLSGLCLLDLAGDATMSTSPSTLWISATSASTWMLWARTLLSSCVAKPCFTCDEAMASWMAYPVT
jgi:hypothetical protein